MNLHWLVPYNKPDISLPADVVEEIMRIMDTIIFKIPSSITITPSVDTEGYKQAYKEKVSGYLCRSGFYEYLQLYTTRPILRREVPPE